MASEMYPRVHNQYFQLKILKEERVLRDETAEEMSRFGILGKYRLQTVVGPNKASSLPWTNS